MPLLKAAPPAFSALLRGGMSLLATVHQSTTRWTESWSIEASAQAQNCAGRLRVLALGVGDEGPAAADRHVLAVGRRRQLEDAVLEVRGVVRRSAEMPQMPTFCMAQ